MIKADGWKRHLFGTLVLALLGGCASMGEQVPLEQTQQEVLPAGETVTVRANWWQELNDPLLNGLVRDALVASPDLQLVKARLQEASAQMGLADAAGGLQIGAKATGLAMATSPKPDIPLPVETDRYLKWGNLSLQAMQSIDLWGKYRNQAKAAGKVREAVVFEQAQAQVMLSQAVVALYINWQNVSAQQAVLQRRLNNAAQIEQLLGKRVRAQLLPAGALYASQSAQEQIKAQQAALTRDALHIKHALAVMSGKSPNALDHMKPSGLPETPNVPVDTLKADLLGKRPDIAAQRALLMARDFSIQSAKAEFYPNIELKLMAGLSHIDAFSLIDARSKMLGVMPAVTLPIFTSGALQANLRMKQSQYNEQVAQYNQTVQKAMRNAADAISDYQQGKQQAAWLRDSMNTERKDAASALRRAQAGLDNHLTYLQKNDAVLQQEGQLWMAKSNILAAWNRLNAELGGGFQVAEQ